MFLKLIGKKEKKMNKEAKEKWVEMRGKKKRGAKKEAEGEGN